MLKKIFLLLSIFNISVAMNNNNILDIEFLNNINNRFDSDINSIPEDSDSEISTENFYTCHLCPLRFSLGLDLSNHLKNSHQICPFCLLKFENIESVSDHEELIHHFIY